jgi:hypothetical protein
MSDDVAFVPNILLSQAMTEPGLFGRTFRAQSFWTWKVVAKIIDGLPLTEPREIELYERCTGRVYQPNRHERRLLRRLILLAGRRAGKDRFFSALAVWRAALCANWRKYSSPGELQTVLLVAAGKKQTQILRRYCEGLLAVPLLAREVTRRTTDVIEFKNGASLEIVANDVHLIRGRSAIAVIGSECSHWQTDEYSASNDEEVVAAAAPSLAMSPDQRGLLCMFSSVYRKRGQIQAAPRQRRRRRYLLVCAFDGDEPQAAAAHR